MFKKKLGTNKDIISVTARQEVLRGQQDRVGTQRRVRCRPAFRVLHQRKHGGLLHRSVSTNRQAERPAGAQVGQPRPREVSPPARQQASLRALRQRPRCPPGDVQG